MADEGKDAKVNDEAAKASADAEAAKKAESATDDAKAKESGESVEDLKKHVAALNREAEKHRKKAKDFEEKLNKLGEVFGFGEKKDAAVDAVTATKKAAEEKHARILLKSAFVAEVAKEAHSADAAFAVAAGLLKSVSVDIENESVDADALKGAVAELKKQSPFLFQSPAQAGAGSSKVAAPLDGNGRPVATNGNPYLTWRGLKDANRSQEAAEFYRKNFEAIRNAMPK